MAMTLRGVKRGRPSGPDDSADPIAAKIQGKIHHSVREVRKAAKKAKMHETQRLVKRLKTMRAQDPPSPELPDLESQLATLKTIEIDHVANYALKNKFKKDKVLSEDAHVQAAITSEIGKEAQTLSAAGTPALKIENRLLSSKALSSEVNAVVKALRNILQPSRQKVPRTIEEDGHETPEPPRKAAKLTSVTRDPNSDDEDDGAEVEDDGWESGTVQEESDAADSAEWESGSVDGVSGAAGPSKSKSEAAFDEGESNQDADSDTSPSAGAAAKIKAHLKNSAPAAKDAKGKAKVSGVESTFLPSLAVGYTRGDSDASDIEDADEAPRKNRRGQRARRAIWEKKFGKNANHVKKHNDAETANARDKGGRGRQGPPLRPGAAQLRPVHSARPTGAPPRSGSYARTNHVQGAAQDVPQKNGARQATDKPLHPSWEAKKRLKEKLNPTIVPAQGKKIVF